MRPSKVVFAGACVVTALILQICVIDLVPFPLGRPQLLVVVVVALALSAGPLGGVLTGFAAGLLADAVPPADHTLGRLALALGLVGYGAGLLEDVEERSVLAPMVVVGVATAVAMSAYVLVGMLVGDERSSWHALAHGVPGAVLYDVILTPFVVPLVAAVVRRLGPEVSHR